MVPEQVQEHLCLLPPARGTIRSLVLTLRATISELLLMRGRAWSTRIFYMAIGISIMVVNLADSTGVMN